MSYTNIDNSIMDYKISPGAFKLYFLLQSMCYEDKTQYYPSQKYLAEKLNRSVKSIQRYLSELLECGLISKRRRGSISNIYTVMLKVISQRAKALVNTVKGLKDKSPIKNKKKYNKSGKRASGWDLNIRPYDFDALESMLLGEESYDPACLYK